MRKSSMKKHQANAQKLAAYLASRNAQKVGTISPNFKELDDGVWIDNSETMLKYLPCNKQYGILKSAMESQNGVKARILNIGISEGTIESLQIAVMKKDGTGVSFWMNDIPEVLEYESVQHFAFVYSMTYEYKCSVTPIGRECDIFDGGDEKEMCVMVIENKAG